MGILWYASDIITNTGKTNYLIRNKNFSALPLEKNTGLCSLRIYSFRYL